MSHGRSAAAPVATAALLLLAASAAGCGTPAEASPRPVEIRVGAAASLRDAAVALAETYAASHPGVAFTLATGSSTALRTQVEQGAPIDVLLSADEENPRALADAGLAAGEPVPIAGNALALVVPPDNPAAVGSAADLARPGVRVVAAGDAVPITGYARRLLANVSAGTSDPAAFLAAVDANTMSREDDVAAVLARIELGEGDAALVYATDALANPRVATVPIPAGHNVHAVYTGVVVASSDLAPEAAEFLSWIAGPGGRAVLGPLGFTEP